MLLDKMYEYWMDPTRTLDATEWTQNAGRTDGWTDRPTDGLKPTYPPTTSLNDFEIYIIEITTTTSRVQIVNSWDIPYQYFDQTV